MYIILDSQNQVLQLPKMFLQIFTHAPKDIYWWSHCKVMIKMGSKKVICNLYVCVFIYCFAELEPSSPVALAMEVEYDEDDNDVVMFDVSTVSTFQL